MTATTPPDVPALAPDARVHLVGIGGAGMSALAWILLERGHEVSGSDLRGGRAAAALAAMGARVSLGHDAAAVEGADVVAVSTAIPADNPEVARARELGLPVLRRAELLAALVAGHRALLVAGTHGKTTTTSMVTVCLQQAALDPSFAIGGTLHDSGTSAHHGSGSVFVAEADESDRSFLVFRPDCAVVTNVELDHHDHYADLDEVVDAFAAFLARRADPQAPAILCADDPGARTLAARAAAPIITYGESPDADVVISDVVTRHDGSRFRLRHGDDDLGPFTLRVPGRHNVLNATAAVCAARWAGAPLDAIRDGLAAFRGAARRFQRIGEAGGVVVVDDYGHHPTELVATLEAARQYHPSGRVVAVFQPHRYSRTAALGAELGRALAGADVAVVTEVYGAGEPPVPGVTGALVAEAAREAGVDAHTVPVGEDVVSTVVRLLQAGDLVLTLGAGDITELGPRLLQRLEAEPPPAPSRTSRAQRGAGG
ncbi:MAG TPA: UDP-N-acetylmuramate--L-alanine ligase [Egibacteraceae bacterium]